MGDSCAVDGGWILLHLPNAVLFLSFSTEFFLKRFGVLKTWTLLWKPASHSYHFPELIETRWWGDAVLGWYIAMVDDLAPGWHPVGKTSKYNTGLGQHSTSVARCWGVVPWALPVSGYCNASPHQLTRVGIPSAEDSSSEWMLRIPTRLPRAPSPPWQYASLFFFSWDKSVCHCPWILLIPSQCLSETFLAVLPGNPWALWPGIVYPCSSWGSAAYLGANHLLTCLPLCTVSNTLLVCFLVTF